MPAVYSLFNIVEVQFRGMLFWLLEWVFFLPKDWFHILSIIILEFFSRLILRESDNAIVQVNRCDVDVDHSLLNTMITVTFSFLLAVPLDPYPF